MGEGRARGPGNAIIRYSCKARELLPVSQRSKISIFRGTFMRISAFVAALGFALAAAAAYAQSDADAIKAELRKKLPDAPAVDSVRKTPYGGLFEVVSGGEIFYTNDKADF